MGFWQKIFGSTKSIAPQNPSRANAIDPSVFCDGCNQPSSFAAGTYYSASEFITLVKKGLEPHHSVFFLATVSGISKEAFIADLPGNISSAFKTGWLLCPSCATQANDIQAKPAGNLPGGDPAAKNRERTALDAGTGKMLTLARAVATKAMTGGGPSAAKSPRPTVQADYYIISILPPEPDPASRDALIERILGAAGYAKGSSGVSLAVSKSGAAALESFTLGLLFSYEKSSGKGVDQRRTQMHEFKGLGAEGKLVAVYYTSAR